MKLAHRLMMRGQGDDTVPMQDEFSASEAGVLYIPKPIVGGLHSLYQDSTATVPVTADGDPVGWMRDYSGNGYHASQYLQASKPIYRNNGSVHWLEFDGADDYMTTISAVAYGSSALFCGAAVRKTKDTTAGPIFASAPVFGNDYKSSFYLAYPRGSTQHPLFAIISSAEGSFSISSYTSSPSAPDTAVITCRTNTGIAYNEYNNAGEVSGATVSPSNFVSRTLRIGTQNNLYFKGNFYGGVIVVGGGHSASNIKSSLALLAGITI